MVEPILVVVAGVQVTNTKLKIQGEGMVEVGCVLSDTEVMK